MSSNSSPKDIEEGDSLNRLPKARLWDLKEVLYQWEGAWLTAPLIKRAMAFRSNFRAREDDIILASTMKTGTTWLKALAVSIAQGRGRDRDKANDVLTIDNPHFHVPTIEAEDYMSKPSPVDLDDSSATRLFHTHLPYALLPDSVKSTSKIVYICRDPKDTLVSMWHFTNTFREGGETYPLQKAVDGFCAGLYAYGSYFDHVAGYWAESRERPEKVLFVKYEEMMSDPKGQVARIADFMGRPFVDEKEMDEVLWRCSFQRLKNLEVNKKEALFEGRPNQAFFRKASVGDWRNYLTPEMQEKIDGMTQAKLEPLGLFP